MRFKKENIIRGTVVTSAILIVTTTPFCVSNKDENSNDGYCLKESVKSESYDFEEASIELMSNYVVKLSDEDSSVKSKLNSEKVKKEKKKKYKNYYTKTNLRLRKKPTLDSEVMEIVGFNKKLKAYKLNKDWYEVRYDGHKYYASADYISKNKMKYKSFLIPNHSEYTGKKTWMPYTAITNRSSKQYKLQKLCSTGNYGIRTYNGRYCVALG
ncbi:MAG: SH3 domain-containing protein, partial [Mycoplasma sp.]|nr:SH3 domain-containing protein [Candidatus Hennigella equi]